MVRLPPLYAIVDPLDTERDPVALADAMLAGGARLLQLRLKAATSRELLRVAEVIRERARGRGATFLVNDRPDVARAVDADGVHLGQDDLPVAAARHILGPGRLLAQLRAAEAEGADYVAVGPVYATQSKAAALAPRGLELVQAARAASSLPIVAIGGITLDTAPALRAAGADSVAMIAALVRAPDVEAAVRHTIARLR